MHNEDGFILTKLGDIKLQRSKLLLFHLFNWLIWRCNRHAGSYCQSTTLTCDGWSLSAWLAQYSRVTFETNYSTNTPKWKPVDLKRPMYVSATPDAFGLENVESLTSHLHKNQGNHCDIFMREGAKKRSRDCLFWNVLSSYSLREAMITPDVLCDTWVFRILSIDRDSSSSPSQKSPIVRQDWGQCLEAQILHCANITVI